MKKTQTIVDRERLSSDYIESKQDFSNVLSQVKQLPTTTWNNPWFYGPIGIAVFTVTVSIVSLNPTIAKDVEVEHAKKDIVEPVLSQNTKEKESQVIEEIIPEKKNNTSVVSKKEHDSTTNKPEAVPSETIQEEEKLAIIDIVEVAPVESRKVSVNNMYPHIAGVFTGEISLNDLFSETGIQLNPKVKVTSFEFNYFNGKSNVVQKIEGNQIPADLKATIELYNVGQMIFITNIKAVDERSKVFTLPSLNYKPVIK